MTQSDPIPEANFHVERKRCSHSDFSQYNFFREIDPKTISLIFNFEFSRPDGQKKAYVRLAPDYDALDVASKIGII